MRKEYASTYLYIRQNHEDKTDLEMADDLQIPITRVRDIISRLGLDKKPLPSNFEQYLLANHENKTAQEMANYLRLEYGQVYYACKKLNILPKPIRKHLQDEHQDARNQNFKRPPAIYSNENSYLSTLQKYSQ